MRKEWRMRQATTHLSLVKSHMKSLKVSQKRSPDLEKEKNQRSSAPTCGNHVRNHSTVTFSGTFSGSTQATFLNINGSSRLSILQVRWSETMWRCLGCPCLPA